MGEWNYYVISHIILLMSAIYDAVFDVLEHRGYLTGYARLDSRAFHKGSMAGICSKCQLKKKLAANACQPITRRRLTQSTRYGLVHAETGTLAVFG